MKQIFESHETVNKLLEDFSYLLFKCLTRNLESQENCEAQLFCKWDNIIQGDSLPKGCILQKILSVQMLDVEGTKYYSKFLNEKNSEWGYVKDLLKGLHPKMCVKCSLLTMSNAGKSRRNDFMFAPYLVAAVANDCSLMITLRKILGDMEESTMENIVESKYGKFVISIGVFDLYPKPMSTIRKHELRNKNYWNVIRL
ncbi:hypothetical protein HHI36_008752 [Cryptolaemus montrouzieri]|uniref:Inositol-pentakisphosphate 2-kinase n=1 Tax=Cryptolaemus montrouzieri TaxID=559131 RepID=A0ABD2MTW7_9CUCU